MRGLGTSIGVSSIEGRDGLEGLERRIRLDDDEVNDKVVNSGTSSYTKFRSPRSKIKLVIEVKLSCQMKFVDAPSPKSTETNGDTAIHCATAFQQSRTEVLTESLHDEV